MWQTYTLERKTKQNKEWKWGSAYLTGWNNAHDQCLIRLTEQPRLHSRVFSLSQAGFTLEKYQPSLHGVFLYSVIYLTSLFILMFRTGKWLTTTDSLDAISTFSYREILQQLYKNHVAHIIMCVFAYIKYRQTTFLDRW